VHQALSWYIPPFRTSALRELYAALVDPAVSVSGPETDPIAFAPMRRVECAPTTDSHSSFVLGACSGYTENWFLK
jgi:hypothetical protein